MNYDALGNITKYHTKGQALDYTYDLNRNQLLSVASATDPNFYNFADGYDERGNVIKRLKNGKVDIFHYNLANQMVQANENVYVYDGHNRRVQATRPLKGDSYAFYTLDGTLIYRKTPNGETNYIFLGDKLIAKDGTEYQGPSSRRHYNPFGGDIGPATDDIGYTGHKFDTDLHLSYMKARYYDPIIGRFYSNDPVGYTGEVDTFNRYAYVANNPFKYIDPNGKNRVFALIARFLKEPVRTTKIVSRTIRRTFYGPTPPPVVVNNQGDLPESDIPESTPVDEQQGKLPKPPTGKGKVPKSERDPKRFFTPKERKEKREEQDNQCANGCGTEINESNSAGHHIDRHADGGQTVPENHAEVCLDCHNELHSGDNK